MKTSCLLLLLLLLCVCGCAHAQTTNTTTTNTKTTSIDLDDDAVNATAPTSTTAASNTSTPNTTATTTPACRLTEDSLAGVDLTNVAGCSASTDTNFCSDCLCSIATALVAGSPTFSSIATSPDASDLNLIPLVEQCAGTLGPALLTALSEEQLTALAACDLNAAAATCGTTTTDSSSNKTNTDLSVTATQGPATPSAVAPAPARAASGVAGVVVSALLAAPVLLAAAFMV